MTRLVEAFIGNPFAVATDVALECLEAVVAPAPVPAPAPIPIPHPSVCPEDVDGLAALPTWAAYAVACAAIDAYGWEGSWRARCAAWGWDVPRTLIPSHLRPSDALARAGVVWSRPRR